ncbi:MAG: FGGY-family carbohydrate kinase [Acuticoccus sp.]
MTRAVLTADFGAGSLRTAAIGLDGAMLAQTAKRIAIKEPQPTWQEVDPEAWWRALRAGLEVILDEVADLEVEAIALTGMTRSEVFLDADGVPLRPAILWRDRRAGEAAAAVAAAAGETNPALAINAFHPVARLAWLRAAEPETFAKVAAVVEPKDYLNFRLTGRLADDMVVAGRTARLRGSDEAALAPLTGFFPGETLSPASVLGPVSPEAGLGKLTGVPVIVSSMDTWAASVGAGAAEAGVGYDVSGTSEAVGLLSAAPAEAAGLVSLTWAPGLHQLGGPTQAGADAVRWAHDTFRSDGELGEALERAAGLRPSADSPLCLIYLLGERAPVWRADVRGALFGLGREHDADDCLWAAMEGVAHAVRDILASAEAASGTRAEIVRICGGGARSMAWCQLRADVIGRPIGLPRELECGLIGAAVAAGVAIGEFATLAAGAQAMNPTMRVFTPRADRADLFAARAGLYDRLKAFALAEALGVASGAA